MSQALMPTRLSLVAALGLVLALAVAAGAAAQPGLPKGAPVQVGPVQPWPPAPAPQQYQRRSTPPPFATLLPVYLIGLVALMAYLKRLQEEEEEVTPHTADPD